MHLDIVNISQQTFISINHIGTVPCHKWIHRYCTCSTCTHICSRQVARMRSDRVLHMLRTTRRAVRQNDRAEPLQPPVWSMATPESLQGERSPTSAASHEHPWVCTHACSLTLAMRCAVAAIGRSDRCGMSMHAAHRAVAAAAKNREPGSACGGKGEHYD